MNENADSTIEPQKKPRRLQFSLRALLLTTMLVGCGFGFWNAYVEPLRRERLTMSKLRHACRWKVEAATWPRNSMSWFSPDGKTDHVVSVTIGPDAIKLPFEQNHLELLPDLPRLRDLHYCSCESNPFSNYKGPLDVLAKCHALEGIELASGQSDGFSILEKEIASLVKLKRLKRLAILQSYGIDWHSAIPVLNTDEDFEFKMSIIPPVVEDDKELDQLARLFERGFIKFPPRSLQINNSSESSIVRAAKVFRSLSKIHVGNVKSVNKAAIESLTSSTAVHVLNADLSGEFVNQEIPKLFFADALNICQKDDEVSAQLQCQFKDRPRTALYLCGVIDRTTLDRGEDLLIAGVHRCDFDKCSLKTINQVGEILKEPKKIIISRCDISDSPKLSLDATTENKVDLKVSNCPNLSQFEILEQRASKRISLNFGRCPKLVSIDGLEFATQLRTIELYDMQNFEGFADLGKLKSLKEAAISNCPKLKTIDWLPPSVRKLSVAHCPNLKSLEHLRSLKNLSSLRIDEKESPIPKEEVDQLFNDLIDQLKAFDGPEELEEKFAEVRELRRKRKKKSKK